ncbi:DUF1349 domain-containing protein [Photobacterium sanctipauli]|uniref:DUF1349 domain-containing protein n=1 Tax=Photobacterium sanctipauli TaxID=1342794 RepID=A0A2T3NUD7_9GAMM|nr:DUF1349 domain-containing protein [Photobacterium sanctipauli]PSW19894.1 DUF1349 domain-containing protein [Photobacterium sanctipauli]
MSINFCDARWLYEPKQHVVNQDKVTITTEPFTDFWQRSFFGLSNDNAPALLIENSDNVTFTLKVGMDYRKQFDQCGLLVYINNDNWFKASIEYETDTISRLGTVVTNFGYSDWASVDICPTEVVWYRLSRRGPDFLIEYSLDGESFMQMRIFHMHKLGQTTVEMGNAYNPLPTKQSIRFGVYASSPLLSSFEAVFSEFKFESCRWGAYDEA